MFRHLYFSPRANFSKYSNFYIRLKNKTVALYYIITDVLPFRVCVFFLNLNFSVFTSNLFMRVYVYI